MADFSRYDIGRVDTADLPVLRSAVRRAARKANELLREIEKSGKITPAYRMALRDLGTRNRYKEQSQNMSRFELEREYVILRDFLTSKTSTLQGYEESMEGRFQTAVHAGYDGSREQFDLDMQKFFSKEYESLFSSDVIYRAITTGTEHFLTNVIRSYKRGTLKIPKAPEGVDYTQGHLLREYRRRVRRSRERAKKR